MVYSVQGLVTQGFYGVSAAVRYQQRHVHSKLKTFAETHIHKLLFEIDIQVAKRFSVEVVVWNPPLVVQGKTGKCLFDHSLYVEQHGPVWFGLGENIFFRRIHGKNPLSKKSSLTRNRTWIKSLGNFYSIH